MVEQKREDDLEIELSDEDILDAMKQISGYIDIFTDDFRTIYHFAHRHAVRRLTAGLKAHTIMRRNVPTLTSDLMLDEAARIIAQSGHKGLPVVDPSNQVIGMLTETDFLMHLNSNTFLELFVYMLDDSYIFSHRCHETKVSDVMTTQPVCVPTHAGFGDILRAFEKHEGRSLPVVDSDGRLQGLLLRKDFLSASHLERLV